MSAWLPAGRALKTKLRGSSLSHPPAVRLATGHGCVMPQQNLTRSSTSYPTTPADWPGTPVSPAQPYILKPKVLIVAWPPTPRHQHVITASILIHGHPVRKQGSISHGYQQRADCPPFPVSLTPCHAGWPHHGAYQVIRPSYITGSCLIRDHTARTTKAVRVNYPTHCRSLRRVNPTSTYDSLPSPRGHPWVSQHILKRQYI